MNLSIETQPGLLNDKSSPNTSVTIETPELDMTVGTLIRDSRQRKGLSQKDLAIRCGITPVQLCRIENDECIPNKKNLKMISAHIGISYTTLIIEAGYNDMSGKRIYYKRDGTELNINQLICCIYKADSDLLDYFQGFDYFGTPENVEVLKLILSAMRKEADLCNIPSEKRDWKSTFFQSTFQAIKSFISSSLKPITKWILQRDY